MAIRKRNDVEALGAIDLLDKMNSTAAKVRLGQLLRNQKGVAVGIWDFAVNGGAVSTISLLDSEGKAIVLPANAVVTDAFVDIITAMTSTGNNGTIAINLQSAGDLLSAVDADTLSGVAAGIPVGVAATAIKLTAERTLTVAIATNALLSGKFAVYVEWIQGVGA